MAVNYSTIDLLKCLVLVILGAHWAACLWGLPVSPLFLEDPTGTCITKKTFRASWFFMGSACASPSSSRIPQARGLAPPWLVTVA